MSEIVALTNIDLSLKIFFIVGPKFYVLALHFLLPTLRNTLGKVLEFRGWVKVLMFQFLFKWEPPLDNIQVFALRPAATL